MNNNITFRVSITQFKEVTISKGMRTALKALLFPIYRENPPQKVPAIKALREELGLGLKEAKDIVDQLTPEILDNAREAADPYAHMPDTGYVTTLGDILRAGIQR